MSVLIRNFIYRTANTTAALLLRFTPKLSKLMRAQCPGIIIVFKAINLLNAKQYNNIFQHII